MRNEDLDSDAGSVVRCRTGFAHFYCTGARADTPTRIHGSGLAPLPPIRVPYRLKNTKRKDQIHKGRRESVLNLLKDRSKIFLKAVEWDANPDPDPRIWIHQKKKSSKAKCKQFRIRTWSGSANCTKSNANAYEFEFLNPDSRIFMWNPDSHRVRTVGYGPPPPDPIGLQRFLCKGT